MEKLFNEIKINKAYIKTEEELYKHLEENKIALSNVNTFKLVKNYLSSSEFNKIIENNFDNFKHLQYINLYNNLIIEQQMT
jgi:hypothetical protein